MLVPLPVGAGKKPWSSVSAGSVLTCRVVSPVLGLIFQYSQRAFVFEFRTENINIQSCYLKVSISFCHFVVFVT